MQGTSQNTPHFSDLFETTSFIDDFGWSTEWNEEIEKWLGFVNQKDGRYYQAHKNRVRSDKQRDELLGEYKAAYFVEKKAECEITEFEPQGNGSRKLDFRFKDINGAEWLTEVKSPSWRSEVAREVEEKYLQNIRGRLIFYGLNQVDQNKWDAEITCPLCEEKMKITIPSRTIDSITLDKAVTTLVCTNCDKHIWKSLEQDRAQEINHRLSQPQFMNGEGRSFDGAEGVEDAIISCIKDSKFKKGNNNLLVVTPNMFTSALLVAGMHDGYSIKRLLRQYDKDETITCILILEVAFYIRDNKPNYSTVLVPAKITKPRLKIDISV